MPGGYSVNWKRTARAKARKEGRCGMCASYNPARKPRPGYKNCDTCLGASARTKKRLTKTVPANLAWLIGV